MTDTTDLIREVCELVSQNDVTAKSAAESLGKVDERVMDQYNVTPSSDLLDGVTVLAKPGSEDLNYVQLDLKTRVPLNDITATFGDYQQSPPMPGQPSTGSIKVDTGSETHRATLIVSLGSSSVNRITVRRDTRLI